MTSIRSFWRAHGLAAALVVMAALVMRSVVPGGYMISQAPSGAVISFCTGMPGGMAHDSQALAAARELEALVAKNNAAHEPAKEAAKVCPYAVLSLGALGGADPIQLAAAIAFVLALGFAVWPIPLLRRPSFLTPPLRAPPTPA